MSDDYVALFCPNCSVHLNEEEIDHDLDLPPEKGDRIPGGATCGHCCKRTDSWDHIRRCKFENAARRTFVRYRNTHIRKLQLEELEALADTLAGEGRYEVDPELALREVKEHLDAVMSLVAGWNPDSSRYLSPSSVENTQKHLRAAIAAADWGLR